MRYYNELAGALLDTIVEGLGSERVLYLETTQEPFLDSHIYVECQGEFVSAIYTYRGKYDNWRSDTHLEGALVPILVYNKLRSDYDIFWEGSNLCIKFLYQEAEPKYLETVRSYLTKFADVQDEDTSTAKDTLEEVR